jgi:3',5'-cyclic AMP phosphodiesterase CpdA
MPGFGVEAVTGELTTVADDEVVVHEGAVVHRRTGLAPDRDHEVAGVVGHTLARPPGERWCTFATVNDVHFGEVECGIIEGLPTGPTFRVAEGDDPYPVVMNRGAIAEMLELDPAAVVVKGDLTSEGTEAEYRDFLDAYGVFGPRLHQVRGNHDAYHGATFASDAPFTVDLPGVQLAVIDTTIPAAATGRVTDETLAWLDDIGARADRPVLVFGHHQPWDPASRHRPPDYFGINPDDSERLIEVVARRPRLRGYFAGHTHRNRVRRFAATGDRPWVEVACVKDYPGSWAEYRVHEGGILQIHRRISTPEALAWTEQTRHMFGGMYADYALGPIDHRCFAIATT